MDSFKDFKISLVEVKRGPIRYRRVGSGPLLLILHGNPQTHVMWHKVAPAVLENLQ